MQKIQVFLRDDQKQALKKLSARTGARQSDLVRQSVDLLLQTEKENSEDWRGATRAAVGLWQGRDMNEFDARRDAVKARFGRIYGK